MKLGLWGARMDNSGLGQQTYEFYKNMQPYKTAVMDISVLERSPERVMKQFPKRYKDVTFIKGIPTDNDMRNFLHDLDVVFICESAYNMDFYRLAKEYNVKVAVQYNYEFFDWFSNAFTLPDLFIAPSKWNYDIIEQFCHDKDIKHTYLHCPVNRKEIKRRYIDQAKTFIHIAGRPADHDRNGTYTFLNAMAMTEGELKGIVYTQDKKLETEIGQEYPSIKVRTNVENYKEMYKKGDVLVLPRKYGGNCLPLNEALSAGVPVIMTNISPNNEFLPKQWLVKADLTDIEFAPRFKIPVYEASVNELYLKLRWFSSLSRDDMIEQNDLANDLAKTISWETLKPEYERIFNEL